MAINIAIDGPAGAGKSTIAKAVAKELEFIYVDTGAMYRAMALYLIRKGILPEEKERMEEACENAEISIVYENGAQQVILDGENVTEYLRQEEVGNMASVSSANPKIREKLVQLPKSTCIQRKCSYGWKRHWNLCIASCRCKSLFNCQCTYKSIEKMQRAGRKGN